MPRRHPPGTAHRPPTASRPRTTHRPLAASRPRAARSPSAPLSPFASSASRAPLALLALLALCVAPQRVAALESSVTLRALTSFYNGVSFTDGHWNGAIEGELNLESERNPVVRAQLQLKTTLLTGGLPLSSVFLSQLCSGDNAVGRVCLDVPRANMRFRIPFSDDYRVRFTIGRTRLTWGQGQVFNAGDLLFGVNPQQADYTESTIRDETAVLAAVFFPITALSFVEVVALPPLSLFTNAPIATGAAGVRLHGKLLDWKFELGYLYNGDDTAHNIALSAQGNLGIDFYLSATSALVHNADLADELLRRLQITLGLYHVFDLEGDISLGLRLESLWRPQAEWQEQDGAQIRYALLLYPEVSLSISNAVQIFVRSLFSPLDLSAQLIGGVAWTPYSGLSILFFPTVNIGETSDTFHTEQLGGLRLSLGAQYTF